MRRSPALPRRMDCCGVSQNRPAKASKSMRCDARSTVRSNTLFPRRSRLWAPRGNQSELPVFMVGMPRVRHRLVEQIAASHSRVFGAGELDDLGRITTELMARNGDRPIERWDADQVRELAGRHIERLQELGRGALRVIDKMPDNVFYLGIVCDAVFRQRA